MITIFVSKGRVIRVEPPQEAAVYYVSVGDDGKETVIGGEGLGGAEFAEGARPSVPPPVTSYDLDKRDEDSFMNGDEGGNKPD